MAKHKVNVGKGKRSADPKEQKVKNLDQVAWHLIATDESLVAESNDPSLLWFSFSGAAGSTSVEGSISYPTGTRKVKVPYSLYLRKTGMPDTVLVDGSGGDGPFIVIDDMGGMTPQPGEGDGSDEDDHQHDQHGGQG
jgi:hypothetical protein